jgi:CRISPR-associated exonuclease Cas4
MENSIMYSEDDLLPISALQHLAFCERQWGLIHLEGQWVENQLTAEGRILHETAHEAGSMRRGQVRIARGLSIRSFELGLIGKADIVEFHPVSATAEEAARLDQMDGYWQAWPVEYKRGRPKPDIWDEIQLCAQALCLEEMLSARVPAGEIYYGQPRRRMDVTFTEELRQKTTEIAAKLHELRRIGITPPAKYEKKCEKCSLISVCLPKLTSKSRSVASYLSKALLYDDGGA